MRLKKQVIHPFLIFTIIVVNVTAWSYSSLDGSQAGLADRSFQRGMDLEKSGYARAASQAFHEAATMYQCFLDFENEDENQFQHVTDKTQNEEIRSLLGYITVRLAHLSHDAMGDSKAAARLYRDATKIDPFPSSIAWHGVGTSLEAASGGLELDRAIEAYGEAMTLKSGSYRVAFDLAVALERTGAQEEAEKIMEKLRRGGSDANSLVDSWGYVRWHTRKVEAVELNLHRGTRAMLQLALNHAWELIHEANGLVCEFGVASGRSMRMTKEILPLETPAYGFDTFTGLPHAWGNEPAGSYSTGGVIPRIEGKVFFYKGLFSDTIPRFLEEHPNVPLALANIDCDLYSSTYDILEAFHSRIVPGTIFIFDEYICHPTWRQDEFRAWRECCKRFGWTYEYIGFSLSSRQAIVRVISIGD